MGKIRPRRINPGAAALSPAMLIVLVVFVFCVLYSLALSLTDSKLVPTYNFVEFKQYARLFVSSRWMTSLQNLMVFGVVYILGCLTLGLLLAIALDQKIRGENVFRTIFLYPHALSYVVTGLAWQWFMNPTFGLQEIVRSFGFASFTFDWLVNSDTVIFAIIIAALWQGSGFIMALLLASLRGVDQEIWKAAKIDGIPTWRTYLHIVLPSITPMITFCVVLLAVSVVKSYDLVVAMTAGGPGIASELPAKFVVDNLFERNNIGLAMAGAGMLLVSVICAATPLLVLQLLRSKNP
ncbi:sugar ABC transporter permease [Simiduia curdlanivorans]|uniref:Carbohydrate ABC transporter permease n=1 Tax=Simiduia curdlanivorans TaxID=1492769 RepID=A0ABV8V3V4_9GAMM|nr:sugar ABC transporter permease [Simiduia curdlanivorans]MDN3640142.1 sugar ABC transporter permease [Simiduia curdlanivorans]